MIGHSKEPRKVTSTDMCVSLLFFIVVIRIEWWKFQCTNGR
jgi:hypothetical protein